MIEFQVSFFVRPSVCLFARRVRVARRARDRNTCWELLARIEEILLGANVLGLVWFGLVFGGQPRGVVGKVSVLTEVLFAY